jgi:hypothetical protein
LRQRQTDSVPGDAGYGVDKLVGDLNAQRTRHHQARYLFGVGATLLLSGTAVLLINPGLSQRHYRVFG